MLIYFLFFQGCLTLTSGHLLVRINDIDITETCVNGVFQSSGHCACFPGFSGDFCTIVDNANFTELKKSEYIESKTMASSEYFNEEEVVCENGVKETTVTCTCNAGFTGQTCDTELAQYSGSGVEKRNDGGEKWVLNTKQCVNGVPVYHNSCICHFGYTGVSCDSLIEMPELLSGSGSGENSEFESSVVKMETDESGSGSGTDPYNADDKVHGSGGSKFTPGIDWSPTPMDFLRWRIIKNFPIPSKQIVSKEHILEELFVPVGTGLNETKTELHVSIDSKNKDKIFRFSFVPSEIGGKSRLEITTCFTQENDMIEKYNTIPEEFGWMTKMSCPVGDLSLKDLHTHSYEIYIPKEDFNIGGQYILTQWHGSANPTLFKDQNGCISQVSYKDLHKICSKGFCDQGQVFNQKGLFVGLQYCQGGYPPLTFSLKDKHFMITARSDEKVFIDKGGCSVSESERCPDHPRQHVNILWKLSAEKFKFDEWVKFRWEIKWSEYNTATGNFKNPGTRTTDAWIRVWMNDKKIVDWIGPCGRNDKRTPYFKAGIYNPSGSVSPIRMFFRRYKHEHEPIAEHKNNKIKKMAKKLQICDARASDVNQNALKSLKNYKFTILSSASENKCRLFGQVDHMAYLRNARLSKTLMDTLSRRIMSYVIYALDDQAQKIKQLEKKLSKYEKLDFDKDEEEDYDNEYDYESWDD